MSYLRTCRIEGCGTTHRTGLFSCAYHWRMLPAALRDAVWRAYRQHGVFSNEYMQAAENAEAYLEHRPAVEVGEVFK
jgi:hypothetical protein